MVLESTSFSRRSKEDESVFSDDAPSQGGGDRWESVHQAGDRLDPTTCQPLVSIVVPAYNEAAILTGNLTVLCRHMQQLERDYRWEIVVVNDGSRDETGALAEAFARQHPQVFVIHHATNFGLGQALQTGFAHSQGDYIVTLDLDLSYAPDHIERLLARMEQTQAKLVVTSPYMKGGKVSNVPWLRLFLSVWANRFLSLAARRNVSTLTGMVRAYDAEFLRTLNLRSDGMEINPEVVHKAMLLNAKVDEIPAELHWLKQPAPPEPTPATPKPARRKSSMRLLRHTWATFYYGFVFRPVMFFIIPSLLFFLLACYGGMWVLVRCWTSFQTLAQAQTNPDITDAVAMAFQRAPHTFFITGIALTLAVQLFSLGVLAVQSKRYFEEIFYLGTAIYKSSRR